jgi:porin
MGDKMFTKSKPKSREQLKLGCITLLVSGLSFHAMAYAQSAPPPPAINLFTPSPLQNMAGYLYSKGVYFTAGYGGQFAANPSGGAKQGADYAGKLYAGVTFDMQKLVGIKGGYIHVLMTDDEGRSLSTDTINTDLSTQNLFAGSQTYQLAVLTWEQKLFNNKVDLNFGRTDLAFVTLPLFCDFQSHGLCGRPSFLIKTTSVSVYSTAVWGGRILVAPTPNLYAKVGIYQPNPDLRPQLSHGLDFGIKTSGGPAAGYVVPVEVGFVDRTPGASTQNQYAVGVIFSNAEFSAPFDNSKAPERSSRMDWYVMGQQMVYQTEPNSPRGVYVFGLGLFGGSGGEQEVNFQGSVGAVWQGPFASRPLDRIDFQANDAHFNNDFLQSEFAMRQKEHGTEFPKSNQFVAELNYSAQINRWLQFMPNLQYIVNPDGLASTSFPKANVPNAFVVGLQFNIDFAALLGIPSYPWSSVIDN